MNSKDMARKRKPRQKPLGISIEDATAPIDLLKVRLPQETLRRMVDRQACRRAIEVNRESRIGGYSLAGLGIG